MALACWTFVAVAARAAVCAGVSLTDEDEDEEESFTVDKVFDLAFGAATAGSGIVGFFTSFSPIMGMPCLSPTTLMASDSATLKLPSGRGL